MPEEILNNTKLMLIPYYFQPNDSGYKLPKLWKRLKQESDDGFEKRIKNYMLNMSDNDFVRVGDLIDPHDATQFAFFELYNEISEERNSSPEPKSKCVIF